MNLFFSSEVSLGSSRKVNNEYKNSDMFSGERVNLKLMDYLCLAGLKLGYLLNFGEALMMDGI